MFKKGFILVLLLTVVFISFSFSQNELGIPYIKNYAPKDYNSSSTIWDITQGKNGIMYFGVSEGVLQYDGTNWQVTVIDNQSTARALDVDENGVVYVGAKNEFGYLSKDSLKQPIYVSLSSKLKKENQDFSDVWNVYATNEGVFFLTFKRIYRWHNNQLYTYNHDDISAHLGFYVNNNLYLILKNKGLHVFKNNKFVPVKGGDNHIKKTIFSILPYDNDNIIVASRKEGLELHNIKTGDVTPFKNNLNEELKTNKIYHGALSENKEFIFATLKNGVYILNKKGELVQHITQNMGLQNNNVKYVFKDNNNGIWVGTAVGISYINLDLPLTYFNAKSGIKGFSRDVVRHDNVLYVATGNSVYYLDNEPSNSAHIFKPIENADDQFWNFCKINKHLIVAGSKGLYEIKNNSIHHIHSFNSAVFSILQSSINPNRIYFALKEGIAIAEATEDDKIKVVHKLKGFEIESHEFQEDKEGNLWVLTAFDYLVKIDKSSFDKEKGYPVSYKKVNYSEKSSSEEILKINDEIYFTSNIGLLSAGKNDSLIPSEPFIINGLPKNYSIRRLRNDAKGNLWIHYHQSNKSGQFLALKTGDNKYKVKEYPFTRINEKVTHTNAPYIDTDGIVWYSGGEGLVRYDSQREINKDHNFNVNIRKVTLKSDSIISYGSNVNSDLDYFTYKFKNNAITFSFSAASYGNEKENKYQYLLEGYDENWSDWNSLNFKEYNYLPENTYTFKIRAKNIYKQISNEDQFTFSIMPPWYREAWAYFLYVLVFILLIILVIKLSTYRLLKAKKQLEEVIISRTKDITIEKEKVELQKLELEHIHLELSERNRDTMDSIQYAYHIQSSILPSFEKFKRNLKEGFIFYRPRDIVSGDFYWFEKINDYFIIACADCTGHGVPGALMSMIGATLLDKIAEKNIINNCNEILINLDNDLNKVFQKEGEKSTSRDGIDLAIIAINLKKGICNYSGAYRPLYFIRDNELTVYSANRNSVGGRFKKSKVFMGEDIPLQSGDQLYMFSDGFTDQFGGKENKKFKRERLKKLLLDNCAKSMQTQHQRIEQAFNLWKGDNEQIDDVLLMGLQIP